MAKSAAAKVADAKTPLTLDKVKQEKDAIDILTEVEPAKATTKEYSEKRFADGDAARNQIAAAIPEWCVNGVLLVLNETFTPKLLDAGKVLKSTGTNGEAAHLPKKADALYDRLEVLSAEITEREIETLSIQNEIRRMCGGLAFGVLDSRRKAVCRELVHQPPKYVTSYSYRQFKWVKPPMVA